MLEIRCGCEKLSAPNCKEGLHTNAYLRKGQNLFTHVAFWSKLGKTTAVLGGKGNAAAESVRYFAIKSLQCTKSWHEAGNVSRTQAIFQSDYAVLIIFAHNKPSIFQASFPLLFY